MAAERVKQKAPAHIPNLDGSIMTRCCQEAAIGTKGHRAWPIGISNPRDGLEAVSVVHVPHGHEILRITTEERLAIRSKRESYNSLGTAVQGSQTSSAGSLTQFHDAIAVSTRQQCSIRTTGQRPDPVPMSLQ